MSNCPDWLKPFQRETEALAAQNAAFREETERIRRENDAYRLKQDTQLRALRDLNRNPEKVKQVFESSRFKIKSTTTTAPCDPNKHTGRTTRLLKEAYSLASEGRAVYVLGHQESHASSLEFMFNQLFGLGESRRLGVKFETPCGLPNFDFRTMTLGRGAHPNCCVLVDHYTIESHYARMLQELHRFDAPSDTN
jgi:hypothetical protein